MPQIELLTGLVIVVLVAVVFFVAMKAILSAVARLFRGGPGCCGPDPPAGRRGEMKRRGRLICPNDTCRHVNVPGAKFCARCGRSLLRPGSTDVDGVTP